MIIVHIDGVSNVMFSSVNTLYNNQIGVISIYIILNIHHFLGEAFKIHSCSYFKI
jgi:hypothetical protein